MGLLSGGAAALFGELLSPLYLPAVVKKQGTTFDDKGGMRRTAQPRNCCAQVDRCTERMVQTEGYTTTDRGIYILADTLDGELDTDCEVTVLEGEYAGTIWKVSDPIDRDPAAAYWLCRGARGKAVPDA